MSKLLGRWSSVFRSRAPICIKLKSARDNRAENACCFGSRKLELPPLATIFFASEAGIGNRGGWQSLWACSALAIPHYTLRADTRAPSAPRSVPYLFWSSSIP
jgi:hypothetical protein